MFWFIVQVGLLIAIHFASKALAPKPASAKKAEIGEFNLPRSEEAVPVPLFWGRVRQRGPVVIMARRFYAEPIKEEINGDYIAVGYRYHLGLQFLVGAPGARYSSSAPSSLRKFWIGERLVWSGKISSPTDYVTIERPTLLGGDGGQGGGHGDGGGGVGGVITYLPGSFSQENGDYTKAFLANCDADQDVAYRGLGVVSCIGVKWDPGYWGGPNATHVSESWLLAHAQTPTDWADGLISPAGFWVGDVPSLDGWSFELDAPSTIHVNSVTIGPIGLDANPISVAYDIVTNSWARCGLPTGDIDEASWQAASFTLAAEGNGFSLLLSNQMSARDALGLLLEQVSGIIFEDPSTGTLKFKLVRDDYTVSALPLVDESSGVEVLSFEPGNLNDTYNEVRVTFTDREASYADGVAPAQNMARFYAIGSRKRSKEISYPGCCSRSLAAKLASRDLKVVSLPLSKLRIATDRSTWALRPGDVFRFSWSAFAGMTDKVFRVIKFSLGKPGDERVVLDCVEDVFAFDHKVFRIPPIKALPTAPAFPSTERIVEESPRFFNVRARDAGRVVDADLPRAYHLAVPRGTAITYHAEVTKDGNAYATDLAVQAFPDYFEVETAYARELEPYDTSTGLRITLRSNGWTPGSATATEISTLGKNTIRVEDEYMAFEGATLISGTAGHAGAVYLLDHVWRQLFDTVARSHDVGARGFVVAGDSGVHVARVGRVSWKKGDSTIAARQVVSGRAIRVRPSFRLGTTLASPDAQQVSLPTATDDDLVNEQHPVLQSSIGSRPTLPYPPADLKLGGTKTSAQLVEGGVDATWKRRDRLNEVIVRGDASDEEPEAGTFYTGSVKRADQDDSHYHDANLAVDYSNVSIDQVLLGRAGYGAIDVAVRAFTYVWPADRRSLRQRVYSWQAPALEVDAPHYRNLLRNGRFAVALAGDGVLVDAEMGWFGVAGSPTISTGASGLGGAGSYVHPSAAVSTKTEQEIYVSGYNGLIGPANTNVQADIHFYYKDITAGGGTLKVTAGYGGADTDTGALTPSSTQWKHGFLTVPAASTPAGISTLDITIDHGTGGGIAVTEVIARLGQTDGTQLLTNPYFGSGSTVGWTTGSGAFAYTTTAPIYEGAGYAHATGTGTGELYQEVVLPAGFEVNTTALVEFARMDAASGDQGEVILEARDAGGTVLATTTTGAEHVATGTWERRRLMLEIPLGATKLRLRFATTDHGAIDDCDLRVYKHLDSDDEREFRFDDPASQPVPADLDYFDRAWPTIAPPDVMILAGGFAGTLGVEAELGVDDDATAPPTEGAKYVGPYDATTDGAVSTLGIMFPPGCDSGLRAKSSEFGRFTSADSFTLFFEIKAGDGEQGREQGLVFRGIRENEETGEAQGWMVYFSAEGYPIFLLAGSLGVVSVEGGRSQLDGVPRRFAISYDAATRTAYVVDESGVYSADASGVGEIDVEDAFLTFGDFFTDSMAIPPSYSQTPDLLQNTVLGRAYGWRSAVATADLQSMMTYGTSLNADLAAPRYADGWLACVVGSDADGVLVSRFDSTQAPFAYSAALDDDDENGLGFPMLREQKNAVSAADQIVGGPDWVTGGTAIVANGIAVGPEGLKQACSITGTNAGGAELRGVTAGSAASKLVMWFARAAVAHTARLELSNASGVVKGAHDYAVTTEWALYWHAFTTWDDSTPTCRLRWCASSSGSSAGLNLCGPFLLNEGTDPPPCMPLGGDAGSGYLIGYTEANLNAGLAGITTIYNVEGEILVEGACPVGTPVDGSLIVDVVAGTNKDYRALYVDASGELTFDHMDGSASTVTSSAAAQTDWDAAWMARGRWCRAGLLDGSSLFAGCVRGENLFSDPSDYGRTSSWTPSMVTEPQNLQIGIGETGDPLNCVIRRVIIRSREQRL